MIDQAIIVVYLLLMLTVGLLASRKVNSFKEFALSGGNYGAFIVFATLSASFIGGGFSSGNAAKVFLFGVGNIVCLWGFSLKELLVARYIVPRMDQFSEAVSAGDIIRKTYGKGAQILTGFFSMLLCAGIVGAQVGAMGDVFSVFTGMNEIYGILIGCGIAIVYSTFGGMKAVVITDIIQFIILAVGVPLVLLLGVPQIGGFSGLVSDLPPGHLSWIPSNLTWIAFASLFLTLLLGETLVPPYVQRLLIGRDLKETARGTYWSGIFSIPFFAVTGLIGLLALKLDPTMDSNLALPSAIKMVLPAGLRGLVVAGVISIVMSSADSFLNSAAVAFTNDIYKPWKTKEMSTSSELFCARTVNLIAGILAIFVAISIPNLLDILIFAYTFWAPVILVPLAGAILGFGRGPKSFFAGAVSGIIGILVWKYGLHDPGRFDGLIFGVFTSLIGYTMANALAKRVE